MRVGILVRPDYAHMNGLKELVNVIKQLRLSNNIIPIKCCKT